MDHGSDSLRPLLQDALHPAYQLLRQLGEGGMGAVYLARDPALKRDVAVKVLRPDLARDPVARSRFEREAESVAAISHPNVINIYTVGQMPDGTPYFVMQFATGRSLEKRLEQETMLPEHDVRRIVGEIASALAAAHKRGIIHRDIKPANVLQDEASGRVIVTDFGIAAVQQADPSSLRLTQTGASPGTPSYMSPEQLLNEPATDKTDVYSLGIMAYELLTGAGPFRATSPHQMAAAHLRDVPAPLSQIRSDVEPDLEQLVASCLAKKPEDRPTAESVARLLLPGGGVLLEWPPPGLERLAGRWPAVNSRIGLGALLVVAGTLGMILSDPAEPPLLPNGLLAFIAVIGTFALAAALFTAFGLLTAMRRAVRRGYRWTTVAEAAADMRLDTGALITGARDYAMAPPGTRQRLRRWRVLGAACASGAALLPVPSLLLGIRSHTGQSGPLALMLMVLLPAFLLFDAAWALRILENRIVHRRHVRSRRERKAQPPVAGSVVTAWNASFDGSGASAVAPGAAPFRVGRIVALVALPLAGLMALLLAPLMTVNPLMDVATAVALPKFSVTRTRILSALAGRRWAPAPDPAISPQAAGEALHALGTMNRPLPPDLRPPRDTLHQPFLPIGADNPFHAYAGRIQDSLMGLGARRAFSPAQLAWLRGIADNPGWRLVRIAARAPNVDLIATRYRRDVLVARDSYVWSFLTLPRNAEIRDAAFATGAVAALRLAEGRPAEAEAVLRDAIGLGLAIMDHGVTMLDALQGTSIVGNGLDRLTSFYDVTGRTGDARRLRDARDSARARADQRNEVEEAALVRFGRNGTARVRSQVMRLVADSTMPASFRWEFVRSVALQPCLNAHDLVFGGRRDVDSTIEQFRRQVVRSTGDSLFLNLLIGTASVRSTSSVVNLVYGNSHVATCVGYLRRYV